MNNRTAHSNSLIIRHAEDKDKISWLKLRTSLWPKCLEEEHKKQMIEYLNDTNAKAIYVAENTSGCLIGFIEISIRYEVEGNFGKKTAYLEGIYVEPLYRNQQIGSKLMLAADSWAREKQCSYIGSDVEIENVSSISFHRSLNFKETNRLIHYIKELKNLNF